MERAVVYSSSNIASESDRKGVPRGEGASSADGFSDDDFQHPRSIRLTAVTMQAHHAR
jgi:hypothetical protein